MHDMKTFKMGWESQHEVRREGVSDGLVVRLHVAGSVLADRDGRDVLIRVELGEVADVLELMRCRIIKSIGVSLKCMLVKI